MSHDQATFYQLCLAVVTGIFPSQLQGQKFRPLCHSCWLTLGQRILALYMSKKRASQKLTKLAKFTVRAYASVWFAARRHPRVTDAPCHVHNWMKEIQKFDEKTKFVQFLKMAHTSNTQKMFCLRLWLMQGRI